MARREQQRDPYAEAVRCRAAVSPPSRFCSMEFSRKTPLTLRAVGTDSERRGNPENKFREMRNSRGEWETWPSATRQLLKDVFVPPKRE